MTLNLRTTTSAPTFSYQDANPEAFYIQIHASIKHSVRPELPVTLATWRTPLERRLPSEHEEDPTSPVWLNSALTPIRSTTDPEKIMGPEEMGWKVHRGGGFPRNLRDAWDFITIPPAATSDQPVSEVTVRHLLPTKGLNFRTRAGQPWSPGKGEKFVVGPASGALGTFWWRFGDLERDLKTAKFIADDWWSGEGGVKRAAADYEEGQYLESEGATGFGLTMEVETAAEFEIC